MYTVKQLANLSGVSVRTLHYYDEFELLKPSNVGENGYRYYDDAAVIRLQQILFYRELDIKLAEIKEIISDPGFNLIAALQAHKSALKGRAERICRLIETIDATILHLKGKKDMTKKSLFEGFSEEEQMKYAEEAERIYDPKVVKASQKKWAATSKEERQRIAEEGDAAYEALKNAIPFGPESDEAQTGVQMWRDQMAHFWKPDLEQLIGLTELYNSDARFKANFDRIDPRLTEFISEAVKVYVRRASENA